MNWANEHVLVTGGGGFLGRYIVEKLLELKCGDIRILGRSSQQELKQLGVDVVEGDLRDYDVVKKACENRSIVFHVAAKAGYWGAREDYFSINVTGTDNILKACMEMNVGSCVYTSSPSVAYPPTKHIENMDEDAPYPASYLAYYPESKAVAEQHVLQHNSETLKTTALRPHLIWGPRDPHLLPRVIERAKQGRLRIVGDGLSKVDMTYVENAAVAHLNAAENLLTTQTAAGKAYFISDDQPVKLWKWINELLVACHAPTVDKKISYNVAYGLGLVMEGIFSFLPASLEPPMTRFVAGQLAFSHYFNISRAKNELNYSPAISPEVAFKRTVDWLEKRLT
jgi:nucleoside-diphosphate-sugar epimerase